VLHRKLCQLRELPKASRAAAATTMLNESRFAWSKHQLETFAAIAGARGRCTAGDSVELDVHARGPRRWSTLTFEPATPLS